MILGIIYLFWIFVTFFALLWINRRQDETPKLRPTEVSADEYYEDHGDGAAMIVGALVGAIIWPFTWGVFVYYRYFDKN
jgi:hypothetical protein